MSDLVKYETDGDVAILTIDNPPVNALSPGVPEGILEGMEKADADPAVKAVVMIGAGRTFISGADIKAMNKGYVRVGKKPHEVIDSGNKPVVAAIHGYALGGGYECALAADWRIAKESAKVGLPEVLIGILPGSMGTLRLPRLIGAEKALDIIVAGRHVPAPEAKQLGMIDEVVPENADLRTTAIAFARKIAGEPRRILRHRTVTLENPNLFDEKRKKIARTGRNQRAPYANIEAVEASLLPFDEGMAKIDSLIAPLRMGDEAKALRYAFFAEREAGKIPDVPKDVKPLPVTSVAVVGAGTMGGGIAMSCADFGLPVQITDATQEGLDRGMARIRANYETSVKRGSLDAAEMAKRLALISPVVGFAAIKDADVVIEAVFEEMPVKKEVFRQLDAVMKEGALLLSNTSALDVDEIASVTRRPEVVAGAHFFSPANVMKLLEIVKGSKTSKQTIATVSALSRRIGKIGVVCGNCDGFLANRSRAPFNSEMVILLEEGALPEQVDKVMVDFGYPMGPFAVGDLAGLDIGAAGRRRRLAANPNGYRTLPIADAVVEMGRFGQKTGAGWYRYEKGDRTPHPDPVIADLIKKMGAQLGVQPRSFTDEEILQRLLFSSVNEACKIIDEGIAYRASDVDVMWLYGFGFPRYRGGLMYWADQLGGPKAVLETINRWHATYGDRWKPAALLEKLAAEGKAFGDAVPAA